MSSYYFKMLEHSRDAQHRPIVNIRGQVLDAAQTIRLRDELLALLPPDPASGAAAVSRLAADYAKEKEAS